MNSAIKTRFTIKDLENLSGIKAHTIRIWEKRHRILTPTRTDTNIRVYSSESLQKLLNVKLLTEHGYKLVNLSTMNDDQLTLLVRRIVSEKSAKHHAISSFKFAMMNFDQPLFFNTYNALLGEKSFREVFHEVFIPLMEEIGLLWQTNTITPAHEHFISYLLRQKILTSIEKIQVLEPTKSDKIFVLFLPKGELHDVGLMYLNYEITLHGYRSIYLGESVPMSSMTELKNLFKQIVFVTYLTIEPQLEELPGYIEEFRREVMVDNSEFWLLGKRFMDSENNFAPNIRTFPLITNALNEL